MNIKTGIAIATLSLGAFALTACGGGLAVEATNPKTPQPVITLPTFKPTPKVPEPGSKFLTCTPGSYVTSAKLVVVNKSTVTMSYLVIAELVDHHGNRLAELNGAANNVQAGTSATVSLAGAGVTATKVHCRVAKIHQNPSI